MVRRTSSFDGDWLTWVGLAAAVVVIGACIWLLGQSWQSAMEPVQRPGDEAAQGTVVDVEGHLVSDREIRYHPIIRFTTTTGEEIEAASRCAGRPDTGDRVEIFYARSDPEDLCIVDGSDPHRPTTWQEVQFVVVMLLILGAVTGWVIVAFGLVR